jgi:co-chaperonin GroES (HSP10)
MKVLNDLVLIRMDPDDIKVAGGLLFKPDNAMEHVLRTGEVLQVGPGKWSKDGAKQVGLDLEPGEGVVFIRFVADSTKTAQSIKDKLGAEEALIRFSDVLLAYDRSEAPKFGQ